MNWYFAIKHLHVACAVLSISGFVLRGVLMLADSPLRNSRWLRIAPHVNDTLLLLAALALTILIGQYPFVDSWLTAKVFGLIAYIVLGSLALKMGRTRRQRTLAWLAAIAVFAYVVSVALSRDARGIFAG
ncbi:MAG: SirB2 family protein [Gammaproteobacteria bacterium]|nr:SirB2 family protein [Gammaproteobacteria bacterium]MBU1647157.1 SirB2 family protein [Gammaproteobacteria bacterium]MBU1972669.1 SirB2 family protein [Gammaproteobacteria bacterium]